MTVVSGDIKTVLGLADQVTEVWVRSGRSRADGGGWMTEQVVRHELSSPSVRLDMAPGVAVLVAVCAGVPVESVPLVVPASGSASLGECIAAGQAVDGVGLSALEELKGEVATWLRDVGVARDAAKASQVAAAGSAAAAKSSETAAKSSETAAKSSQTAAKASQTAAKASQDAAAGSAAAAKSSETAAKNSQLAVEEMKNAARGDANAAAVSAHTAKNEADRATTAANKVDKSYIYGSNVVPYNGSVAGWADLPDITRGKVDDPPIGTVYTFPPVFKTYNGEKCRFSVIPGVEYYVRFWMKADKPGSMAFIELSDESNPTGHAVKQSLINGKANSAYLVGNHMVPDTWTLFEGSVVFRDHVTVARFGRFFINHQGGSVRDATVSISDIVIAPRMPVGAADAEAIASRSVPKEAVRLVENEDLNTKVDTGFYNQAQNAGAASGSNYPEPTAGLLTVVQGATGTMTFQYYTVYNSQGSVYVRKRYLDTWYPWRKLTYEGHFHTSNDVSDAASGYALTSAAGNEGRLVEISSNGTLEVHNDNLTRGNGNAVANKRYVDTQVSKAAVGNVEKPQTDGAGIGVEDTEAGQIPIRQSTGDIRVPLTPGGAAAAVSRGYVTVQMRNVNATIGKLEDVTFSGVSPIQGSGELRWARQGRIVTCTLINSGGDVMFKLPDNLRPLYEVKFPVASPQDPAVATVGTLTTTGVVRLELAIMMGFAQFTYITAK